MNGMPTSPNRVRDLYEIACPWCGDDSALRVLITTWAPLSPDGTDANDGEHDWHRHSSCVCDCCGFQGIVADFSFSGGASS